MVKSVWYLTLAHTDLDLSVYILVVQYKLQAYIKLACTCAWRWARWIVSEIEHQIQGRWLMRMRARIRFLDKTSYYLIIMIMTFESWMLHGE